MWSELGLNLEAHDALLGVLGPLYEQTFLGQHNRPQGMEYFDFVMSEVHGLRIRELMDAKAEGRKVVGAFCTFLPEELVLAVDALCVGLCAGADFATDEVEKIMPRNTCSLIKGAFGFAIAKVCPYLAASDLVVGENTCDGKKKGWELFGQFTSDMHVIDLPQVKGEQGRALLTAEYLKLKDKLENISCRKTTAESLRKGIDTVNAKRSAMHRMNELRRADPAPISGLDALLANQVYFYDDPGRFTESVGRICDELEQRAANGEGVAPKGSPRILVSGCPMAVPNWKVPTIVESARAVIVGEESCVGERGTQELTRPDGDTVEAMIDSIVDRYLKIDCAIFSPNESRLEHIRSMAETYKADGVIHYGLNFCHPYQIEAGPVEQALEDDGIPTLRIDTDYSPEDSEQIRTRVEAFIERIKG
jgi:benzoyl-CoA reductase/2-hydroxyglutaryl-CoA dehydratase subunit BcrC/BadD/HgdB